MRSTKLRSDVGAIFHCGFCLAAQSQLLRDINCTIEGVVLGYRESDGVFVVWWLCRDDPNGDPIYSDGFYTKSESEAKREFLKRTESHLETVPSLFED